MSCDDCSKNNENTGDKLKNIGYILTALAGLFISIGAYLSSKKK